MPGSQACLSHEIAPRRAGLTPRALGNDSSDGARFGAALPDSVQGRRWNLNHRHRALGWHSLELENDGVYYVTLPIFGLGWSITGRDT